MTTLQLDAFLPYRLSIASNRVSDVIATAYQALFGLKIPEWRLITILAERPKLSQHALCGATRMDKVTVSRAAIALVDRDLVLREPNPDDQRSHLLSLSNLGRQLYDQVVPKAVELERKLFADFSKAEREQLSDMLLRLEKAAGAYEAEQI